MHNYVNSKKDPGILTQLFHWYNKTYHKLISKETTKEMKAKLW